MKYNELLCKSKLNSAYEYTNEVLQYEGIKLKFDFNIFNCVIFNAQSTLLRNGEYFIKVNDEVFKKIFQALNVLLSKENENFYKLISYDRNYNDKKVMIYYSILLELMGKIVFYHEIGHIINGHLRYMLSKNQVDTGSMFMNSSSNNDLPNLERQVLEMDADAFSATMLIRQVTYANNLELYSGAIKGREHGLFLLIVSANLLFAIQGLMMYEHTTTDLKSLTYLPLKTRRDYYVRSALSAHDYYNPSINCDIKTIREIYPVIDKYIELLNSELWNHNDFSYKYENFDLECLRHCDFLDEFWTNKMRDKLIPYSYTKNLAK